MKKGIYCTFLPIFMAPSHDIPFNTLICIPHKISRNYLCICLCFHLPSGNHSTALSLHHTCPYSYRGLPVVWHIYGNNHNHRGRCSPRLCTESHGWNICKGTCTDCSSETTHVIMYSNQTYQPWVFRQAQDEHRSLLKHQYIDFNKT